jgi:hypothetical protein
MDATLGALQLLSLNPRWTRLWRDSSWRSSNCASSCRLR